MVDTEVVTRPLATIERSMHDRRDEQPLDESPSPEGSPSWHDCYHDDHRTFRSLGSRSIGGKSPEWEERRPEIGTGRLTGRSSRTIADHLRQRPTLRGFGGRRAGLPWMGLTPTNDLRSEAQTSATTFTRRESRCIVTADHLRGPQDPVTGPLPTDTVSPVNTGRARRQTAGDRTSTRRPGAR